MTHSLHSSSASEQKELHILVHAGLTKMVIVFFSQHLLMS